MIAWGIDYSHLPKQHDICGYINCLVSAKDKNSQFVKFKQFEDKVEEAQYYYYRARWPDYYGDCSHNRYMICIPRDHFSQSHARDILDLAQNIIKTMDEILGPIYCDITCCT